MEFLALTLIMLPNLVMKCLQANYQIQRTPRTPQFNPELQIFSSTETFLSYACLFPSCGIYGMLWQRDLLCCFQDWLTTFGPPPGACSHLWLQVAVTHDCVEFTNTESLIIRAQTNWVGHVVRMDVSPVALQCTKVWEDTSEIGHTSTRKDAVKEPYITVTFSDSDIYSRKLEAAVAAEPASLVL